MKLREMVPVAWGTSIAIAQLVVYAATSPAWLLGAVAYMVVSSAGLWLYIDWLKWNEREEEKAAEAQSTGPKKLLPP